MHPGRDVFKENENLDCKKSLGIKPDGLCFLIDPGLYWKRYLFDANV
jgi:hypothetical protein